MRIAVVDYGMGNLRSVSNAFEAAGQPVEIITRPEQLNGVAGIVLPGVGAFGDAMRNLHERGLVQVLDENVRTRNVPFLGLCLGMQLVATESVEHGAHRGLGWVPGRVVRIEPNGRPIRVPHIGWNDVHFAPRARLFAELGESQAFYFVHSYVLEPDSQDVVSGVCDYVGPFAASIETSNIFGTQFHPEKSQHAGLAALRNFVKICSSTA
jgi:imidazole glycerol-phosphate synthase subunit HisH